jgi:Holliday junction resolvase RusA-like endonuclease
MTIRRSKHLYFEIPGKPVGKERPRAFFNGKYSRVYTPNKTKDYEELIRQSFAGSLKCRKEYPIFSGTVKILITVYKKVSERNKSKKENKFGKENKLWKENKVGKFEVFEGNKTYDKPEEFEDDIFLASKPDLDNIAKTVLDGLNGLAYKDDSQAGFLAIFRVRGDIDKTGVYVW